MGKSFVTVTLKICGMTCVNCENRIERELKNKKGVANVIVSYEKGSAMITYDPGQTDINGIFEAIEKLGYSAVTENKTEGSGLALGTGGKNGRSQGSQGGGKGQNVSSLQLVGTFVIIIAVYIIINRFGGFNLFNSFPQAKEGMGYGMLFIIGLLTSAHCVAMCGGINLSQCVSHQQAPKSRGKLSGLTPSILYNSGRVISYTVIGGLVGTLGSVVGFSSAGKGFIALAAGIFMVIMGLNMLNIFPWLRRFNPRIPKIFAVKIEEQKRNKKPLYVGLLNGLMPCGPLQAMQLYALSTGDPLKGAISMFLFSLGTVPLMFGLGALSAILTKKFTSKMMTVSAALVIILGIFMLGNGMALTGYAMPFSSLSTSQDLSSSSSSLGAKAEIQNGTQVVTTKLKEGRYEPIVVQKGMPVLWNIQAEAGDINGCNNRIIIPEYNLEKQLEPGDNMIEFTPDKSGAIRYSCWMGMIRSQITVVDDIGNTTQVPQVDSSINNNLPSCCGGAQ